MSKQVQNFIDDARRFQRCSDHDLAISSLQLAQQEDHHKEHEIEIQKLFSLSYRKIGNYNMALLHINNAINQNEIITNIPATTVNTVESYNDLFEVWKKNIPDTYLLFQDLDQKLYYISDSSYMPSQLFRKCLAPYLGANYWDWRSESYSNNILETISLFKGIIE